MRSKASDYFLQITGIDKQYPVPHVNPFKRSEHFKALKGVDLNIPEGSVSCILGPNGAGKTTLIKILAGLILQDSGEINWKYSKQKVGLVTPNDRSFYWRLTGRQNLQFFASLYNIKNSRARVVTVLEEVDLLSSADRPYRQYSAGMKQKMNIARALLFNPSLYLLDEPANHLDPLAKEEFWSFIQRVLLQKEGATVILCTHDLEEAATLADHIALLHNGRILAQGDQTMLKRMVQKESFFQISHQSISEEWKRENQSLISENSEHEIVIRIDKEKLSPMVESFLKSGGTICEVKKKEPLLMDVLKHFIGADNE